MWMVWFLGVGRVVVFGLVLFFLWFGLVGLVGEVSGEGGGVVVGRVVDSWEGVGLGGVAVSVRGTLLGVVTDGGGRFRLEGVPGGVHVLVFSKSGYGRSVLGNVRVIGGQVSTVGVRLSPEFYEMEFEVVGEPFLDLGVVLLDERQGSVALMDVIGSDFFARAGAGNAAEIMSKVAGASVVGGKYVFIRGLGDRYSRTTLNGGEVPSPDPDRRAVQMDIFPASSIESIVTVKTFTPDRPGSFSGGSVDVVSRSFPDVFGGEVSVGFGYNPQVSFNGDFLGYAGGGLDYLGFDDGTRSVPAGWGEAGEVEVEVLIDGTRSGGGRSDVSREAAALEVVRLSSLFSPVMTPSEDRAGLKHDFGGSVGDTVVLWGRDLGFFVGLSYERDFEFYDDGFQGRYDYDRNGDVLVPNMEVSDVQAVDLVSWGSAVNLAYRLSELHEVGFNFLYNRNSEDRVLVQKGMLDNADPEAVFERRGLGFTQRELRSYQVRGEHEFGWLGGWRTDWLVSLASTLQDEPDLRLLELERFPESGLVSIPISGLVPPVRYFRSVDEGNRNFKLDHTVPFGAWWSEGDGSVKFGGYYSGSRRSYRERRFEYGSNTAPRFRDLSESGDEGSFLSGEGVFEYSDPGRGAYQFNRYVSEKPFNNYEGRQDVYAFYVMGEVPIVGRLRGVGGVRYETTDLAVESSGERPGMASLGEGSVLPAVGLVYEVVADMNLRLSYGRTLARPIYREITPISVFDVVHRETLIGNPGLGLSSIDNYDFRWEWFPSPGEVLAASVFYKALRDPIQKTTVSANREVKYENREGGVVYGFELEGRKVLDFVWAGLEEFTLGGNFTYVESAVDKGPFDFGEGDVQLVGQSPYIVNLDLTYHNPRSETTVSLFYNVFGSRLFSVGQRETPHIFERPVHSLDWTFSQGLGSRWRVKLSAKNLLDPLVKTSYDFGGEGEEYLYSAYRRGRSFGLSLSYDF